MGQLAPMHDDKMRKDLLGQSPALLSRNGSFSTGSKPLLAQHLALCMIIESAPTRSCPTAYCVRTPVCLAVRQASAYDTRAAA